MEIDTPHAKYMDFYAPFLIKFYFDKLLEDIFMDINTPFNLIKWI